MTYTVISVIFVAAVYLLASRYIRRSLNSFANAKRVWGDLNRAVEAFVGHSETTELTARFAIQIAAMAGCGCFVRGVLLNHYLPRPAAQVGTHPERMQPIVDGLGALPVERRNEFDRIVALVIIYDSFRNPLQGWLFRRILKSYLAPVPSWEDQMEAKLATFSVASRKLSIA